MKSNTGRCGLCLETKELIDSHLFPAAIYKHLGKQGDGLTNKLVMTRPGKAFFSSEQATSYFLCKYCEERFNKGGERYVLTQYARANGQFKLREILRSASPVQTLPDCLTYDLKSLIGAKIDQYLYFAASILWRSSAHRWKINGELMRSISLGGEYQEQFRRYLLNQADFPVNARLFLTADTEEDDPTIQIFTNIGTNRIDGVHRHKFHIPGLVFSLFLGQNAPKYHDNGSLNGSRGQMVHLRPWRKDSLFRGCLNRITSSKPLGKLSKRNQRSTD